MKRSMNTVGLIGLLGLTLSGCASVQQIPIPDCPTEKCFTVMREDVDLGGGGRHKVSGITHKGDDSEEKFTPLVDSAHPDRLDTLGPAAIYSASRVWSSGLLAGGEVDAARESAKGSGGDVVFFNDSSSRAIADQQQSIREERNTVNNARGCLQTGNCPGY